MNHNAVTTSANLECEVDGVKLVGFLVDDGARSWVWARDEADARMMVALVHVGGDETTVRDRYEKSVGEPMDDMWTCPLTDEVMIGVTFTDEDGEKRPMADEMRARQARGIVASSEW